MILKNLKPISIRVVDFNKVAKDQLLLNKLRKLTFGGYSGMNIELNMLERLCKSQSVNAQIIKGYVDKELIAWALLSKEKSEYYFRHSYNGAETGQGVLFEIFVHPSFRRLGIGTKFMKVARRKVNGDRLCIAPHDYRSNAFYDKFKHYNHQSLF